MSAVRMAAVTFEPMVLRFGRWSRASVQELRHGVEHIRDARAMSRMHASMAMDFVPALPSVGPSH
jgi:hypothetical protein